MNGIPIAPTDNMYKFMAISGLWFFAGFIAFYIWLVNVDIQLEKEKLRTQAYFVSVNMEREIENRLKSIKDGKVSENRLDWVPASFTSEQETLFIRQALTNHRLTISKNKDIIDNRIGEELSLFDRWDVMIAGIVYVTLMVGLIWFGFSRWITKTHFLDEKLKYLERDIKIKSMEKMELEIKQLKLTCQSILRLRRQTR